MLNLSLGPAKRAVLFFQNSPSVSTTTLGITSFSTSQFVWRAGLQFISSSHTYQECTHSMHMLNTVCIHITRNVLPTLKSSSTKKSQPIKSKNPRRQSNLDLTAKKHWLMICRMRFWISGRKKVVHQASERFYDFCINGWFVSLQLIKVPHYCI